MQTKSLKIGWILMLILGLYRGFLSVVFVATKVMDLTNALIFFANAVAIVMITLTAYKKAEKWSWWCLFLIGVLPLIPCTLWNATNPWLIAGWIIFLLGIFIPAKAILGKK